MRARHRTLRLLTAILTVWCLGCDAFESLAESFAESRARGSLAVGTIEPPTAAGDRPASPASAADVEAAEACACVLGHAAVVASPFAPRCPALTHPDFAERPSARILPRPEPPLRPPVA